MKIIKNLIDDKERAFYNSKNVSFDNIVIDGPADGESAFKECSNIEVKNSKLHLRYPFWHNRNLTIENSTMYKTTRAALWYDQNVIVRNVSSRGIKAFRECKNVCVENSRFISPEIFWNINKLSVKSSRIEGFYAFFKCKNVEVIDTKFEGKYSFQYTENLYIKNSVLKTKDAFWHTKNVLVENCIVEGEYLGWYSDGLTLKNCTIKGTQPLCYAKRLKILDCKFENCDLAFEYSDVNGNIIGSIDSIKNPLSGELRFSIKPREIIIDENDRSKGSFRLKY